MIKNDKNKKTVIQWRVFLFFIFYFFIFYIFQIYYKNLSTTIYFS